MEKPTRVWFADPGSNEARSPRVLRRFRPWVAESHLRVNRRIGFSGSEGNATTGTSISPSSSANQLAMPVCPGFRSRRFTFAIAFSPFLVVVATLVPGTLAAAAFSGRSGNRADLAGDQCAARPGEQGYPVQRSGGDCRFRSTDTMITIAPEEVSLATNRRNTSRPRWPANRMRHSSGRPSREKVASTTMGSTLPPASSRRRPGAPISPGPCSAVAPLVPPEAPGVVVPVVPAPAPIAAPQTAHATIQVTCDEYPGSLRLGGRNAQLRTL